VVSISGLKNLKGISQRTDGGLKIGALTVLADIAANPSVAQKYPVLAQAAASVGTPQIRAQGTIGGICASVPVLVLSQRSDVFQKRRRHLLRHGGESQYHAIFGGGPCFAVHPSDLAVALVALQAQISVAGPSGAGR